MVSKFQDTQNPMENIWNPWVYQESYDDIRAIFFCKYEINCGLDILCCEFWHCWVQCRWRTSLKFDVYILYIYIYTFHCRKLPINVMELYRNIYYIYISLSQITNERHGIIKKYLFLINILTLKYMLFLFRATNFSIRYSAEVSFYINTVHCCMASKLDNL